MNLQPVIQRELRVVSRRRETWWLRIAFAGGALAAFVFGLLWPHTSPAERGQVVLICMAVCGFALSLFAGPYLTADAISEERREGTLGLLFLTPLNGWEILLGKMATHALQVGCGWVAVFPIFFLPVLMGGVVAAEVTRLLLVLLVTMVLSVACGLCGSTFCTEARTSVLATTAFVLLLLLGPWTGVLLFEITNETIGEHTPFHLSAMTALVFGFESNFRVSKPVMGWELTGSETFWGSMACQGLLVVVLLLAAGWALRRARRTGETGAIPKPLTRTPHTPPQLEPGWLPARNDAPLVWMFGRTLTRSVWLRASVLLIWIFFLVMLVVSVTTGAWEEGFIAALCAAYTRHLLLRLQFVLDATRTLQADRNSGALELLLTTPVLEADIRAAHQQAMRRGARGALWEVLAMNGLLMLWTIIFFDHLHMGGGAWAIFFSWFLGGALLAREDLSTLSWTTFRDSVQQPTPLKAAGRALAFLQVPSWIAFGLAFIIAIQIREETLASLVFLAWVGVCWVYDRWLVWRCWAWFQKGLRLQVAEGR